MNIEDRQWLIFLLTVIIIKGPDYWRLLVAKHNENKSFKQRVLDDNVELARMIQKAKE